MKIFLDLRERGSLVIFSPQPMMLFVFRFFVLWAVVASSINGENQVSPVVYSAHGAKESCYTNLGPTGAMAWMLGYRLVVTRIDRGSPAHGKLELNDVIVAAHGLEFGPEADPRITLGNSIEEAEEKGAPLKLSVLRGNKKLVVEINLPREGGFSPTWPYQCKKSKRILEQACRVVLNAQMPNGEVPSDGNMGTFLGGLLLLASGDPRYLDGVRRAVYSYMGDDFKKIGLNNWEAGYGGLLLAEYFLATGDKSVLPDLKRRVDHLVEGQMPCGGWGHGSPFGGYGALNQVGVICGLTLVLAKECGVEVDEMALKKGVSFFRKFSLVGSVPYGDFLPAVHKFDNNGMNASSSILLSLAGHQQEAEVFGESVAMDYWNREYGHTGGIFSMAFGPLSVDRLAPKSFRKFLDYQKWHYNLIRSWKGELLHLPYFEALSRFDHSPYVTWGGEYTTGWYGLVFALPEKKLRILGAPESIFAVTSQCSGKLARAREFFLEKKWKECDELLHQISSEEPKSVKEKEWFLQLKKARELQMQSLTLSLYQVESDFMEGAPYRASKQLEFLKKAFGEESDERFALFDHDLARQAYGISTGNTFYKEWRALKSRAFMEWTPQYTMAKKAVGSFLTLRKSIWEPLSPISRTQPQMWSSLSLKPGEKIPDDWSSIGYDPKGWVESEGISTYFVLKEKQGEASNQSKVWYYSEPILARRWFEVKDPVGEALKVRVKTARSEGIMATESAITQVFLNGVLVAHINRGQRGGYAGVDLDSSALSLLKKGKNLLAVYSSHQAPKNNSLDVGLYITRKKIEQETLPPLLSKTVLLADHGMDHVQRIKEPVDRKFNELKSSLVVKSITDLKSELTHLVGAYRHQIEDALVRKGSEVLGRLESLGKSNEWRKRAAFCRISGEIADRSTRNKDEKKKDDWVYEGEDRHLIKTEILKALPLLADLLGDEHLWVRYRSAEALMKFGEEASFATSKLMGMIDDTDPWVRQIVIKAIGEIEKDPLKLSEAAHKALKTSNTSFGVSRNAYAIMKETQGDSDGRLDAIVSFLENLPHGYGAKRALKPLMEMGVKLDPEGKKMIPILLKGISIKPGFDHQRLNGRELGMKTLATYGEKARYTVPKLQGLLKEYSGNKGFVKAIQEFLGKLGVEDLIEEKP